jgi:hypothetical protein
MTGIVALLSELSLELWLSIVGLAVSIASLVAVFVPGEKRKTRVTWAVIATMGLAFFAVAILRQSQQDARISHLCDSIVVTLVDSNGIRLFKSEIQITDSLQSLTSTPSDVREAISVCLSTHKLVVDCAIGTNAVDGRNYPFYLYYIPDNSARNGAQCR